MPLFALKRVRIAAAITVLACGSAWLTGCTSEPAEGGVKGAPPSATTPSETDSGTTPTNPSDAGGTHARIPDENKNLKAPDFKDYPGITENTDEGASQTLRFYFDAMYYGYATGDTEPLERVFEPGKCKNCDDIVGEIASDSAEGTYLLVDDIEVVDLGVVEPSNSGKSEVFIEFKRPKIVEVSTPNGREEFEPTVVQGAAQVSWAKSGKWVIQDVAWENV